MAFGPQAADKPFFLVRFHFCKQVGFIRQRRQSIVGSVFQHFAIQHFGRFHADHFGDVPHGLDAVAADDLELNACFGEAAQGVGHVGFGRIVEQDETEKSQVFFIVPVDNGVAREVFTRQSEHPESLLAIVIAAVLNFFQYVGQRGRRAGRGIHLGTHFQHIRQSAFGDHPVFSIFFKHDAESFSDKIIGYFVHLGAAFGRHISKAAQGVVERIGKAGFKKGVQVGHAADFFRGFSLPVEGILHPDDAFGQGAGFVGAKHVDGAEVLDGGQFFDHYFLLGHAQGAR